MIHNESRPKRPRRGYRDAFKLVGNVLYIGICGLLLLVSLVLGVGTVSNSSERTYSGTFTQQSCDLGYRGRCEGVGTWISDNKSMIKKDIHLDGDANSDGTIRADYTPTGFNNDAENNIVHTPTWGGAKYWLPWAMCTFFGGLILFRTRAIRGRRR